MKKLLSLFGITVLSAMITAAAFAGSANMLTEARFSIQDSDSPATIEIYPGDTVTFRLDVAASRSSYPRIYVVPMTIGEDAETGDSCEVPIGPKYMIGIDGMKAGGKGNGQTTGSDPKAGSATFTSNDLGVTFPRSDTYQLFLQVWDDGKELGRTNRVTVTVVEKPFTGVVLTAKRTPVYTPQWTVDRYDWTVLIDGLPRIISLFPSAYTFEGMFLTASTGIYQRTAAFDEGTAVEQKVVAYPGIIEGYSFNPAVGDSITLGIENTEYTFAAGARVYRLDAQAADAGFEMAIDNIPFSWNGRYWLLLDSWGEIRYLFLSYTDATTPPAFPGAVVADSTNPTAANLKQLGIVKKFNAAVGPVDPATGLSTEYAYFRPDTQSTSANGKFPLMIWLHGSGGGANVWSPLINDTGLTRFADIYQPLFAGGGAWMMVPRSNEDFAEGHAMRWNAQQVGSLFAAVDDLIANNPDVDTDRIYIGGFSIGGGMVWLTIRDRPGFFAAAFPTAPPGRFMPDPAGDELFDLITLPIWIVHSVEDTTVRVDTDTQATPNIPWGSRPVMNALIPLSAAIGTDSRLTLLHPVYYMGGHVEYQAIHNNMVNPYTNTLYANGLTMSDPYTDRVPGTLIDWLNEQTASANAARR
jgi:predicted esterase